MVDNKENYKFDLGVKGLTPYNRISIIKEVILLTGKHCWTELRIWHYFPTESLGENFLNTCLLDYVYENWIVNFLGLQRIKSWLLMLTAIVARAYANVFSSFDEMFISLVDLTALLCLLSFNEAIEMLNNDFSFPRNQWWNINILKNVPDVAT